MFEQYDSTPTHDQYQHQHEDVDRADAALEPATRFVAWFTSGIAVTFLIRLLPALQPLYWILVIVSLVGVAIAVRFARNASLIGLAILLTAATLAGHWDFLAHQASQAQEVLK